MLAASIWRDATSRPVAALVLEQDTIPKPDGLGVPSQTSCFEQKSIDFGSCSRQIENRSIEFEF